MRALRLHDAGDIRVEETRDPQAPGPRELLVRNLSAGICGTDLHEFRHGPLLATRQPHPLTGASLPQILGHEFSAEVLAVGDEVTTAVAGDRVAIMPLLYCGSCVACADGRPQVCERLGAVGLNWPWGGLGERAIVAQHQVAVLPDEVTDLQGAMVEPAAVAVHSVTTAGVALADAVLITGAGPIGQLVALAAKAAGAAMVYISEPNDARRQQAEANTGAQALDPSQLEVPVWLHQETSGGVDVAIECVGNSIAADACLRSLRAGGTMMQTGLHTKPAELDVRIATLNDLTIKGANCFPVDSWPRIIGLIASGALPVERIATSRIPLSDAVAAFEALLSPASEDIKMIVEVGSAAGV